MIAKRQATSPDAKRPREPGSRSRRRALGIFYTPPELIVPILDAVLDPILAEMVDEPSCAAPLRTLRLIDPACGSGHFLSAAWKRLARRIIKVVPPQRQADALRAAAASLHGIDIDPEAQRLGAWGLERICRTWNLAPADFPNWTASGDALDEQAAAPGAFDAVVGNPPFVDSESMCRAGADRRRELARRFEVARGNWDLASLFVERSLHIVKTGGRVGLILPRRLFASDHACGVQRLMAGHTIELIHANDPTAFDGARVETVSVVMRRQPSSRGHCIRVNQAGTVRSFAQEDLQSLPPGHWSAIWRSSAERHSAASNWKSSRCLPRLSESAFVGDGATTGEAYRIREAIAEARHAEEPVVRLINTGTIDPFAVRWGERPTRYLRTAWRRPVIPLSWLDDQLRRRAVQARSRKVLVAGLAGRIEAVVDEGLSLCGKSAVQIIPDDPDGCHAICAWLNSTPINDLYRLLFESKGFGHRSMHIGPRQIEQLPLWDDRSVQSGMVDELAALSMQLHTDAGASDVAIRIDALVAGMLGSA